MNILPVIMAGGSGSRLWPLSRTSVPKQFLSLVSESTMLQDTVLRIEKLSHDPCLFICNEEHRFILAEQLRQSNTEHSGIILEPVGRNTAPAIALAALKAIKDGADPMLLVLAADHVISNEKSFIESINRAKEFANDGMLVTFGIVPTHPETGYGYIEQGEPLGHNSYRVKAFVEKPDLKAAESYLTTNSYCWNSGMFLFKASTYLNELKEFNSEIYDVCQLAIDSTYTDLDFIRLSKDIFDKCPDDSIDYAVMERTDKAIVVPMDAGWSDLGSWSALWDVQSKDDSGNASRGDVILDSTTNSYINAQSKLVVTVGISDLVIVETKDAVLVAHKEKVQNVKNVVNRLKKMGRSECHQHLDIYRPWGKHEQIAEGDRYHVKRVTVRPGEKTATQIHYHRAEHWVVVSGTAKVLNGDDEYLVSENQSTYIPIGSPHSFENPGKFNLELVEVRTGNYLSEDDIVRIGNEGEGY